MRYAADMQLPGSELVGARRTSTHPAGATNVVRDPLRPAAPRRVGRLSGDEAVRIWTLVTSGVVKRGFAVEYRDLDPPRTGIFDGLRIVLDPDVGFEMQCFILLHLFGHSVQWVAPSLEHKLSALQHTAEKERFLEVLHDYEREAAGFGMQLLHELGVTDLDAWFSDFVATDWRYVERFYREDRLPPWEECVQTDVALVAPTPIPPLVQRLVEVRFAF